MTLKLSGNLNTDGSGVGDLTANGIEIFNVVSSGSASAFDELVSNSLHKMVVTGDANLKLAGASFYNTAAVNTLDASAFTGALKVTLSNSGAPHIDVAVTGGKGNDRADFSDGFDKNDAFDGGEGIDTLALTNKVATEVTPSDFGTVKNVEILEITTGGEKTVDLDHYPGVGTVYYSKNLAGATIVQDTPAKIAVRVNNPNGQDLTVAVGTDGTSDALDLHIEEIATAGETTGVITAAKYETVNLKVSDDTKDVGVGSLTIAQLAINATTTLTATGLTGWCLFSARGGL